MFNPAVVKREPEESNFISYPYSLSTSSENSDVKKESSHNFASSSHDKLNDLNLQSRDFDRMVENLEKLRNKIDNENLRNKWFEENLQWGLHPPLDCLADQKNGQWYKECLYHYKVSKPYSGWRSFEDLDSLNHYNLSSVPHFIFLSEGELTIFRLKSESSPDQNCFVKFKFCTIAYDCNCVNAFFESQLKVYLSTTEKNRGDSTVMFCIPLSCIQKLKFVSFLSFQNLLVNNCILKVVPGLHFCPSLSNIKLFSYGAMNEPLDTIIRNLDPHQTSVYHIGRSVGYFFEVLRLRSHPVVKQKIIEFMKLETFQNCEKHLDLDLSILNEELAETIIIGSKDDSSFCLFTRKEKPQSFSFENSRIKPKNKEISSIENVSLHTSDVRKIYEGESKRTYQMRTFNPDIVQVETGLLPNATPSTFSTYERDLLSGSQAKENLYDQNKALKLWTKKEEFASIRSKIDMAISPAEMRDSNKEASQIGISLVSEKLNTVSNRPKIPCKRKDRKKGAPGLSNKSDKLKFEPESFQDLICLSSDSSSSTLSNITERLDTNISVVLSSFPRIEGLDYRPRDTFSLQSSCSSCDPPDFKSGNEPNRINKGSEVRILSIQSLSDEINQNRRFRASAETFENVEKWKKQGLLKAQSNGHLRVERAKTSKAKRINRDMVDSKLVRLGTPTFSYLNHYVVREILSGNVKEKIFSAIVKLKRLDESAF